MIGCIAGFAGAIMNRRRRRVEWAVICRTIVQQRSERSDDLAQGGPVGSQLLSFQSARRGSNDAIL